MLSKLVRVYPELAEGHIYNLLGKILYTSVIHLRFLTESPDLATGIARFGNQNYWFPVRVILKIPGS